MRARHQQEFEAHAADMPAETPACFRRRSPALLELCHQERRLFFQSRFDEAAECDRRDVEEGAEAQRQAVAHWETVGQHLRDKQRREEDAMADWVAIRRVEIENDRCNQDDAIGRRERLLSSEIDGTRSALRRGGLHAMIRSVLFVRTNPRGTILPPSADTDVEKMYRELPPRARAILLRMRPGG